MKAPLYPVALKRGDTLGVVAPAGHLVDREKFFTGVGVLEKLGFKVKFPQALWPGADYLADSDDNRGEEFNNLWQDDKIHGLISLRGGYGCLRMLDRIDLDMVSERPKILLGFSDITVLQNFLCEQTGLVSLHGPVVTSLGEATEESLTSVYNCLKNPRLSNISTEHVDVLCNGPKVTAPIIGGNLASLVTLIGTRYDFSWDGKIVFLEDTNEPAYKIDRMLTQLKLVGKLDRIAGLILGDFSISSPSSDQRKADKKQYQQHIRKRVLELCTEKKVPIWANFPSGHFPGNLTFPLGVPAVMDSGLKQLLIKGDAQ